MSHTPGPWKSQIEIKDGIGGRDNNLIWGQDDWSQKGYPIAEIRSRESIEIEDANARLIAAAPDMLDLLEEILPDIECRCGEAYTGRGLHESNSLCYYAETVKAVITKATGKEEE